MLCFDPVIARAVLVVLELYGQPLELVRGVPGISDESGIELDLALTEPPRDFLSLGSITDGIALSPSDPSASWAASRSCFSRAHAISFCLRSVVIDALSLRGQPP